MSEGFPIVYFLRAVLYAFAFRRAGGLRLHFFILSLALPLLRKVLPLQPKENALVYVILYRLFAYLRLESQPQPFNFPHDGGGGKTFVRNLLFDERRQFVIVADL